MDKNNRLDEDTIRKYSSEFGLTQEQVIEFNAEFKAYDTDRNGTICTEDLGVVNKAFGGNANEDVLREWIKKSDASGDGKVDFMSSSNSMQCHSKRRKTKTKKASFAMKWEKKSDKSFENWIKMAMALSHQMSLNME